MSRTTVLMPDEISIKSLSPVQLQILAADAEISSTGVPEDILRKYLLTCRALFDGREFRIPRTELIDLHNKLFGIQNLISVTTSFLALECALYFWPSITSPTAAGSATPNTGAHPLTVNFASTSTGTISRWLWSFGDGTFGYKSSLKHVYLSAGTYNPTLQVSSPYGSNSVTLTVTVT